MFSGLAAAVKLKTNLLLLLAASSVAVVGNSVGDSFSG